MLRKIHRKDGGVQVLIDAHVNVASTDRSTAGLNVDAQVDIDVEVDEDIDADMEVDIQVDADVAIDADVDVGLHLVARIDDATDTEGPKDTLCCVDAAERVKQACTNVKKGVERGSFKGNG